jgi:predicted RNA-binding Zn-ribbon protein involved in translation (DUF1610 family)
VRKRLGLLCLGFVVLSVATYLTRGRRLEPPPAGGQPQHYLYCAECGLEMTCAPGQDAERTFCPHCGVTHKMELTTYSRNQGEGPRQPLNRLLLVVAFGVPTALAVAIYLKSRTRERTEKPAEGEPLRFACPNCGHQLASRAFRAGSTAVCPECAEQFVVGGPATLTGPNTPQGGVPSRGSGPRPAPGKRAGGVRRRRDRS